MINILKYGNENEICIVIETNCPDVSSLAFNFDVSFDMIVKNKSVCTFSRKGIEQKCICNISEIRKWFINNLEELLKEEKFPLNVVAENGVHFYKNSGDYDSEDNEEFETWYSIRQDWHFKHSWYSANSGSYLADIIFLKKGEFIQISWDNTNLFEGIDFLCPVGCELIELKTFVNVVEKFISSPNLYSN